MNDHAEALKLIKDSHEAVLATLEEAGPFTSAISYFWTAGGTHGKIILLMSHLARHTKNVARNPKASVFVMEAGSAYVYDRKRVAAQGEIRKVNIQENLSYREHYVRLFPKSVILFQLPDFYFYEMSIQELYFIGGFGNIQFFR